MSKLTQDVASTVHSAGLDWLRVSGHENAKGVQELMCLMLEQRDLAQQAGAAKKQLNYRDYEGWTAGGWYIGKHEQQFMFEASGAKSQKLLQFIIDEDADVRCARGDLQVTTVRPGDDSRCTFDTLSLMRAAERANAWERCTNAEIHDYPKKGFQLDIGSRKTRICGRRYCKYLQQPDDYPPKSWRDEWEFKREAAHSLLPFLRREKNIAQFAVDMSVKQWKRRGVDPNYQGEVNAVDFKVERYQSTEETLFNHLMSVFVPMVKKLNNPDYLKQLEAQCDFKRTKRNSLYVPAYLQEKQDNS